MNSLFIAPLLADSSRLAELPYRDNTPTRLLQFAHALARSPLWPDEAVLVVREEPPLLAVLGFFDEASQARLENLHYQLEHVLPTLRYLDYEAVTQACQVLADKLLDLDSEALTEAKFVGLPRGGLIVLGILSYLLGLKPAQLEPPTDRDEFVVVVDDCAISGLRFGRFKQRYGECNLVFATLFSALELRNAIEKESNIRCVSAFDLSDHAREQLGGEYEAWRERWQKRSPDSYWIGRPEQIAFPWNEPDIGFWNPVSEQEEAGWCFLTGDLCLKHRHTPRRIPIHFQQNWPGPLAPAPSVLYGRLGERLLIGDLRTGQGFALNCVAANMWEALVRHGALEAAVLAMEAMYDADRATLHDDLKSLADNLESRGLLSYG